MSNNLYENLIHDNNKNLFVVAYYFIDWKNYNMEIHSHDRIEFMYVLSGICKITVKEQTIAFKKGDFIYIDANIPHKLTVEGEQVCRMLNLEMVFHNSNPAESSLSGITGQISSLGKFVHSKVPFAILKDTGYIFPVIRNIINECDERNDGSDILVSQLITELFIRTSRLFCQNQRSSSQQSIYADKTIRFLYQNYDRRLKINDISGNLNLHPSYLQRIFKAATGKSIIEYLQQIRIEKAKMFLSQHEIRISDVANMTGFDDPKYFSSCFKKVTGISPVSYRSQSKFRF